MSDDLPSRIVALLSEERAPLGIKEILLKLGLPADQKKRIRDTGRDLVSEGKIRLHKGGKFGRTLQGSSGPAQDSATLVCKSGGHWYLRRDAGDAVEEMKVPAGTTGNALPGDLVGFRRIPAPRGRMGGNWAKVTRILRRSTDPVIGLIGKAGSKWRLEPHTPGWPERIEVDPAGLKDKGISPGDIVDALLLEWRGGGAPALVRVRERIVGGDEPGADMLSLMRRHTLPLSFPPEVEQEAAALPDEIQPEDIGDREDWRETMVVTIDPFDARDFDDAFHVQKREDGTYRLAVHIADVSHFVRPGSAMDTEARKRGNSVYLADRVIPMLPEKLSNGLCSLQPGVMRFTALADLTVNARGVVTEARFAKAVIRSSHRYSYEQAYERMMRDKTSDSGNAHDHHLDTAWELAEKMRARRRDRGALEMDFPEVRALLDEEGRAIGLRRSEYDESHQMIEEFMLAANEAVARNVKKRTIPAIHRVHEEPDFERLWDFQQLARDHGHKPPDVSTQAGMSALAHWIKELEGRPEEHLLKLALLKSMRRAMYSAESTPHFGLATDSYLHFTSPIRRYADLVAHRALFEGKAGVGKAEMESIARHLSDTERSAADAEKESQTLKQLEYLDFASRQEKPPVFDAIAVGARPFGLLVELTDYFIKGLIRREDLPSSGWRYFAEENRFGGREGSIGRGDRFRVRVARVNLEKEWVDFEPVSYAVFSGASGPGAGKRKDRDTRKKAPVRQKPTGNRRKGKR